MLRITILQTPDSIIYYIAPGYNDYVYFTKQHYHIEDFSKQNIQRLSVTNSIPAQNMTLEKYLRLTIKHLPMHSSQSSLHVAPHSIEVKSQTMYRSG